jgi:hypothetical protein
MNHTLLACSTLLDKKIMIDYVPSRTLKPMSSLCASPSHHLLRSRTSVKSGFRKFIITVPVYLVSSLARKLI